MICKRSHASTIDGEAETKNDILSSLDFAGVSDRGGIGSMSTLNLGIVHDNSII